MERIYTDISDFEDLRRNGGVYVDKTDRILPLVDMSTGKQFFLSRPRRFGKSLLISTIKYLFQGRRDLFEGLAIADPAAGWDWEGERCPVLHLDMSECVGTMEDVKDATESVLCDAASAAGIPLRSDVSSLSGKLSELIYDAATASPTGKCVVLVDNYEMPVVPYVGTPEAREFQEFLMNFYCVLKSTERFQRFCLVTGVLKVSLASEFSGLNNLNDLTMSTRATTLLGYTHEEVRKYFPETLEALADTLGTDADGAFAELVENYDGYCFDDAMVRVFNPLSIGSALSEVDLKGYWFETGTPGWLMSYAKKAPIDMDGNVLTGDMLGTFEPASPYMTTVLFQTGYLTITGAERESLEEPMVYKLGYPNREVRNGFSTWLSCAYVKEDEGQMSAWQMECKGAVRAGDAAAFVESLQSLFSSIGYDLTDRLSEQAYQCVAVAILRFIGVNLQAEVTTSRGRIDMVCKSAGHVFVIEMKVATGDEATQAAAREAIAQIRERGYADPYRAEAATGARRVQLLGLAFDCDTHNISAWACEDL